jgi:hypothetical protein
MVDALGSDAAVRARLRPGQVKVVDGIAVWF